MTPQAHTAPADQKPGDQPLSPPYVLALDIGTSSARALLYDSRGRSAPDVRAQQEYPLTTTSEGEVSVDADKVVDLCAHLIDQALQQAGPRAQHIAAVAMDTYWHNLLAVDEENRPLIPLITWEDTRPRQAAGELCAQLDEAAIHKRTGARLHASYWPAKIRWLAQSQPAVFHRVARYLSIGEYLHRRFLGRSVCSLSMASGTGMLRTRARVWDEDLMRVLDVRPHQLPPLGDLGDRLQGLQPAYAQRWPTLHQVPWFPAIGDGAAANIGSGCVTEENWAVTMGTSSALRVIVRPDQVEPTPALWLYLVDAKRGLLGGALSEGGNVLAWIRKMLGLREGVESDSLAAALPPNSHGLTILPMIAGERSPGWHAGARMAINGINLDTTPAQLLRAAMESLAYQLAEIYDQLNLVLTRSERTPHLVASGGALLHSPCMQSIVADVLHTPLHLSLESEASARGAALLALEALGIIPVDASSVVEAQPPILPNAQNRAAYQEGRQRHQTLYQTLLGP